jgi:hypothetical protein
VRKSGSARSAVYALIAYIALTLALTWPLARGLAHDVPGDFGDPLFQSWVLAWDATHLGPGWLDANIYYPHPLALAYSEFLLPQALQILPVYALTSNPILCYNLLFLSTFALSGLGMFLFARDLTGSRTAAFVAGLAFAFAPYRIASVPHMQVLSAAWLPFALYGFRRFLRTGGARPLAGAALAWTLQNLSCGYYLMFFSPAIALYLVWEITTRRAWRDARIVGCVALASAAVVAVTAVSVLPYLELRRLGFDPRSLAETQKFSADVYAYFTADPSLWLWGSLADVWPKAEGLLFPGLTIVILAAVGAAARGTDAAWGFQPRGGGLESAARFLLVACGAIVVTLLLGFPIRLPGLKIASLSRTVVVTLMVYAATFAFVPRLRATAVRWLSSPSGFFTLLTALAIVASFGPSIYARGRIVADTGLYALLYGLPGFDGLRVPARFAMLAAFGLATLVAIGIAALERARPRYTVAMAGAASVLILLEATARPFPINRNTIDYKQAGLAPLPASISIADVPPVYDWIARLPASAAIAELPLGEPSFDVRYQFYSTRHWRRLVNGYSGGAPRDYESLTEALKDVGSRPDRAWDLLVASRATHAIVHEGSYTNGGGVRLSAWLRARGAREVAVLGSDRVFALQ